MKRLKFIGIILIAIMAVISCSKDDSGTGNLEEPPITGGEEPEEEPTEAVWTVNQEDQYALNIIFFKPSDFNFTNEVEQNVSDLMLYVQDWYKKQMKLNGYGEKTFGLMTNEEGLVRIHVIESDKPSSYYYDKEQADQNSTLSELNQAVADFFNSNLDLKESEHNFILSNEETLIRLVGSGKNAYTRSPDFSLQPTGMFFEDLELMNSNKLGGSMHELAHGLNVPHNAHKNSDLPMVSLMSFGNHVYERNQQPAREDMVFLTEATSAILNVNQVFNKRTNGISYYSNNEIQLISYNVQKDESLKIIQAEGTLESSNPLTHFYIGHNGGEGEGSNSNYDEVAFTGEFQDLGSGRYKFKIDMPYSELFNGYKDSEKNSMLLTLNVLSENGVRKKVYSYPYTIDLSTSTPKDDVNFSYDKHDFSNRSAWTITANSTGPNTARSAEKMLDSDIDSYWHSNYPYEIETDGPHTLTVDMNENTTFSGVYLYSDRPGKTYRPKKIQIKISSDNTNYGTVKEFNIQDQRIDLKLEFDAPVSSRYIKIMVEEVYISEGTEENLILNEIDIIKE